MLKFHQKLGYFILLSACIEQLLTTPKITTFLPNARFIENFERLSALEFLVYLTSPKKQSSSVKPVYEFFDHVFDS